MDKLNELKAFEEVEALNIRLERKPLQLKGTINTLKHSNDEGSKKIYEDLMEFNKAVTEIHPDANKKFFQRSLISKTLGLNKMSDYMAKYQDYSQLIEKISTRLTEGQRVLENDNTSLKKLLHDLQNDYNYLIESGSKLKEIKSEVQEKIDNEEDELEKERLKSGIYSKILQKEIDIEEKKAMVKQGAITIGVLVSNNEALITSVDRCKDVTVSALELTIMFNNSLSEQKKVIDVVNTLNAKTSSMIVNMANTLQTQGVEIQKQANNAMLSLEDLSTAYNKTIEALKNIADDKLQRSEKLEKCVNELYKLADESEKRANAVLGNMDVNLLTGNKNESRM